MSLIFYVILLESNTVWTYEYWNKSAPKNKSKEIWILKLAKNVYWNVFRIWGVIVDIHEILSYSLRLKDRIQIYYCKLEMVYYVEVLSK